MSGTPSPLLGLFDLAPDEIPARWEALLPGDEAPVLRLQRLTLELTRTDPARALELMEHVVPPLLRAVTDPTDRARLVRLHGHALRLTGRAEAACQAYERASAQFSRAAAPHEEGLTAIGWVDALALAGRPDEAVAVANRAARLLARRDVAARARLETNLATALYTVGRYGAAAERYREARRLLRRKGEPWMAAFAAYNLGNALMKTGRARMARRYFAEAADTLAAAGMRVPALYARYSLATVDLVEGHWNEGFETITALKEEFRELGDARAEAAMYRELAEFLASLGAVEAASREAAQALRTYEELGLRHEAAHSAFLQGRLLAAAGAFHDAEVRLDGARRHWESTGNREAERLAEVETARVLVRRGRTEEALVILRRAQRALDRSDASGGGALCRAATAEAHLAAGRAGVALRLARRAHRDARAYPARLSRPWIALTAARALEATGRPREGVRWATRAVDQLEKLLLQFGTQGLRSAAAGSRDPIYAQAVEILLRHGGAGAEARALDLLSRARSPGLIENLLRTYGRSGQEELRSAIARLRDALLTPGDRGSDDVRFRALRTEADMLESRLGLHRRLPPGVVRRAMESRRLRDWRPRLGDRELVLYHHDSQGWSAYCVAARGAVRRIPLPGAERALREHWLSLRVLLETAAHAPPERRRMFLGRTRDEAEEALVLLREALWDPLPLRKNRVVVIPTGLLHSVPLEAMVESEGVHGAEMPILSRLPHPALLRPVKRPSRRASALVLHDTPGRARGEVGRVARMLRGADYSVKVGHRRGHFLAQDEALGLLHVAAHGTFHARAWLLSGLQLSDGWLGFEHLSPARVKGALLYFASCESGMTRELPGAELEGWLSAGLGAGASEMMLTLWKVDDRSATAFASEFYPAWLTGEAASVAAATARRALRERGEHPFSWAPFIAVG